ncbi:MFS transporter [Actinomadura sp. B10D3]|uniref:MFS transporter n=1 Tax=Actinomadura sp. B10D3 TaxID=3153557 RepID=UPI00325D301B
MTTLTQQPTAIRRTRQLVIGAVGNAVEWFDWYVYSMLAVYFAGQFFPKSTDESLTPLLSTLAIFAVGFFMRPLGGLVIGGLADRYGRKRALSMTIIGMGAGSLLIAVAPTYAQAGIAAPAILLLARLIQGLSAGGEYAAASSFVIESAPDHRRGFFSSFFYISATSANLAAIGISALLANLLSNSQMTGWGWRIPFLLGSVAALAGLLVRRHAHETLDEETTDRPGRGRRGFFDFLVRYPKQSLLVFGLTAAPGLTFYVWTAYLPTYASLTVDFDPKLGLTSGAIALTWFLLLQPILGVVSDRVGRRPMLLVFGVFFAVATVPMLGLLDGSFRSMLAVQLIGLTFLACWSSISSAVAAELFPARFRSAGIGLPYAVSVALFGGTGPYVATWLVDQGRATWFPWYIALIALGSTLVYLALPETARKPLK